MLCNSHDDNGRTLLLQLVSDSEAGRFNLAGWRTGHEKFSGRQFEDERALRGE